MNPMDIQMFYLNWGIPSNFPPILCNPNIAKNYNHQIHKVMLQVCIHNSFLQRYKQNSNSMSKLPICEKVNFKSFIKVLKAYGLDQQRPSNIEGFKNSK
jgi:hypothetical protein